MLRIVDLRVSIDEVGVLRGVTCLLPQARTTVLVGRNGAGKTTTLRAIMGLLKLDAGSIQLDDTELCTQRPHLRAAAGIGYAPEDRRLVAEFSVEENILLPAVATRLDASEARKRLESIYDLLPQLRAMRTRPGGGVSGGQGKIVALGRALMVARKVLLLDEPFQGLAPALAQDYARTLREVRNRLPELTMLITESSPWLLDTIADQVLQIERGEILPSSATE